MESFVLENYRNTFDLHLVIIGLENQFLVFLSFESGCFTQVLLYCVGIQPSQWEGSFGHPKYV